MAGAGTLVLVLTLLSVLSSSDAFLCARRCSQQPSSCRPYLPPTLQITQDSVRAEGLVPSLAVRGGGGNVQQVATLAELETILEISGDAIVCVEFTAAWCAPCQQIAPAFEALSLELENVAFLKVDVDDNEETAQKYEVNQMPTFLLIRKGEVVDQFSGANVAMLRQKVQGLLEEGRAGGGGADQDDEEEMKEEGKGAEEE